MRRIGRIWFAATLTVGLVGCGMQGEGATAEPRESTLGAAASFIPPGEPVELTGTIAFDRLDGEFGYEAPSLGTFVRDLDAGEQSEERLDIPYAGDGITPTWSPDGTSLLANVYAPPEIPGLPIIIGVEDLDVAVVEPEGSAAFFTCSDWSPDGDRLACSLDDDANPDTEGIYTVGVDGSELTRVTTSPNPGVIGTRGQCGGNDFAPAFSPDGTQIAFVRARCGDGADPSANQSASLWIVNADGTDATEIVPDGIPNSHGYSRVRWSPDGTRLVFGSEEGGIYLASPSGGTWSEIRWGGVDGQPFAYTPDWSPDGSLVIFSVWSEGGTDLYATEPKGGTVVRVTDTPGAEVWVSWTE